MGTEQFGRLNMMAMLRTLVDAGVVIAPNNGVPVNGISGTGAGSFDTGTMIINTANGDLYANTGTKASPVWALVADQAADIANLDGSNIAPTTALNPTATILMMYLFDFTPSSSGTVDLAITEQVVLIDVWLHMLSNLQAGTVTVFKNTTNVITALSTSIAVGGIVRATNLNTGNFTLVPGDDLSFGVSFTGNPIGQCWVLGAKGVL